MVPHMFTSPRWQLLGIGILAVSVVGPLAFGRGQQPNPPAEKLKKLYYGISDCRECHLKGREGALLCNCKEQQIWEDEDKHREAYNVLSRDRAKEMGRLLGYDPAKKKECIVCHGVYVSNDAEKDDKSFKLEDGVSCVACHGPYDNWYDPHSSPRRRDFWRNLSRTDKETQYGMTDLWDPVKRARMCATCHIGSSEEEKVVTHEMYAAGHPPLPSFEVATYSKQMPKHWQYLREKDPKVQKLLRYDSSRLEETELVLLGGLASFRESMNLLSGEAAKKGSLDLAQFDCASCHHELKRPSSRQRDGYPGIPGRPHMQTWPLGLVHVGIRHVAGNEDEAKTLAKELHDALAKLHRAYDEQPFGNAPEVATAAKELVVWSDAYRARLAKAPYDKAAALRILHELAKQPAPDFETARQLAWAFETVYADYVRLGEANAEVMSGIKKLREELSLKLPSGKEGNLLKWLPIWLKHGAAYEPEPFQNAFAELATRLPAK